MNAQPGEEFCPRCGHWVDRLNDVGWCALCGTDSARHGQVCTRCSTPRPASHYTAGAYRGRVCRTCRNLVRAKWRREHPEQEAATDKRKHERRKAAKRLQTDRIGPDGSHRPAPVATSRREATMHHHTPIRGSG